MPFGMAILYSSGILNMLPSVYWTAVFSDINTATYQRRYYNFQEINVANTFLNEICSKRLTKHIVYGIGCGIGYAISHELCLSLRPAVSDNVITKLLLVKLRKLERSVHFNLPSWGSSIGTACVTMLADVLSAAPSALSASCTYVHVSLRN